MQHLMEHLYAKNVGCGHSNITRWEWISAIHRDSYASDIGHFSRILYMGTSLNVPTEKIRYELITVI